MQIGTTSQAHTTYIRTYTYINTHKYKHTYIHEVHTHTNIHIHTYIHIPNTYIYTYIHTYTHLVDGELVNFCAVHRELSVPALVHHALLRVGQLLEVGAAEMYMYVCMYECHHNTTIRYTTCRPTSSCSIAPHRCAERSPAHLQFEIPINF